MGSPAYVYMTFTTNLPESLGHSLSNEVNTRDRGSSDFEVQNVWCRLQPSLSSKRQQKLFMAKGINNARYFGATM